MFSWLYPGICELCGERCEPSLCPACLAKLPRLPRPICLFCGSPVKGVPAVANSCPHCSDKARSFHFARSALMRSAAAMQLIHRLKYGRANYLAPALALLLAELWELHPPLRAHEDWVLVPVPMAQRQLFERGYNQAEELALALGRLMGLRVMQPLQRKDTHRMSQTRLTAAQRRQNALADYSVRPRYALRRRPLPPHLLLVDDVCTTGATARACARALRSLPGVQEVGVITLLRAD